MQLPKYKLGSKGWIMKNNSPTQATIINTTVYYGYVYDSDRKETTTSIQYTLDCGGHVLGSDKFHRTKESLLASL